MVVCTFWHLFWSYSPLVSVFLVFNFCTFWHLFWSYSTLVSVILVFNQEACGKPPGGFREASGRAEKLQKKRPQIGRI